MPPGPTKIPFQGILAVTITEFTAMGTGTWQSIHQKERVRTLHTVRYHAEPWILTWLDAPWRYSKKMVSLIPIFELLQLRLTDLPRRNGSVFAQSILWKVSREESKNWSSELSC